MRKRSWFVPAPCASVLLLCLAIAACGGGSKLSATLPVFYPENTPVPASGPSVAGVAGFDQAVSSLLKKWNIPGAAIAVAKDGKLVLARGYGYADYENKQLMQPDSMFRVGSVSKVLTSMAILHLADQGLLNIDSKFLDILTQYQVGTGGDPRLRDVTIHHLLQHSGGWDRDKTGDPMGWHGTISQALHIPMPVSCPDIIRYMMTQPLDFAPGTKQVYSNFGYCILGRIVEKVSGQPYENYVRDHVLATMSVNAMSIGYGHLSQRGSREVKYYEYDGEPLADSVFPGEGKVPSAYGFEPMTLDACGGWIGSPVDLTRLMTGVDGSRVGPFLAPGTLVEFTADPGLPDWNSSPNYWYGLGIFVGPTPQTWYHGGTIAGALSQLYRDDNGYVWAIQVNSISQDPSRVGSDMQAAMKNSLAGGLAGSTTDLYADYPSPDLPARSH